MMNILSKLSILIIVLLGSLFCVTIALSQSNDNLQHKYFLTTQWDYQSCSRLFFDEITEAEAEGQSYYHVVYNREGDNLSIEYFEYIDQNGRVEFTVDRTSLHLANVICTIKQEARASQQQMQMAQRQSTNQQSQETSPAEQPSTRPNEIHLSDSVEEITPQVIARTIEENPNITQREIHQLLSQDVFVLGPRSQWTVEYYKDGIWNGYKRVFHFPIQEQELGDYETYYEVWYDENGMLAEYKKIGPGGNIEESITRDDILIAFKVYRDQLNKDRTDENIRFYGNKFYNYLTNSICFANQLPQEFIVDKWYYYTVLLNDENKVIEDEYWDKNLDHHRFIYERNENHQLISVTHQKNDIIIERFGYEYDDHYRLRNMFKYSSNNTLLYEWRYDYDQQDKDKLLFAYCYKNGVFMIEKWEYVYRADSTIIRVYNSLSVHTKNMYLNEIGKKVRQIRYDSDGFPIEEKSYI